MAAVNLLTAVLHIILGILVLTMPKFLRYIIGFYFLISGVLFILGYLL